MARVTENSEVKRLRKVYANLQPKQMALALGLIQQAARLRIRLDELNADIEENGMTEMFQQSDKVEPFARERPQASLFVKLDKNYQSIIRQLNDMLPPETEDNDDLAAFKITEN